MSQEIDRKAPSGYHDGKMGFHDGTIGYHDSELGYYHPPTLVELPKMNLRTVMNIRGRGAIRPYIKDKKHQFTLLEKSAREGISMPKLKRVYLQRNPTGNSAIKHGLRIARNSIGAGVGELVGLGITHLAGSGIATTVFEAAEIGTAGVVVMGAAQTAEGTKRWIKNRKRRKQSRNEIRIARDIRERTKREGEQDKTSQEQSARLKGVLTNDYREKFSSKM